MSRIVFLLLIPIGLFIIIICVMQIYTNSIIREVKSAFYCPDFYVADQLYDPEKDPDLYANQKVNYIIYKNDTDNPNIFAHFNVTSHSEKTMYLDEVNIDLEIYRVFTWHNFKKGTLWLRYSLVVTDDNDDIITGSWRVPVRLSIERVDGVWLTTSIYESP